MHIALSICDTNNSIFAEKVSSQREIQRHQYSSVHAQPIPQPEKPIPHDSPSLSALTDSHVVEAPATGSADQEPEISGVRATHSISDMFNNSDLPWSSSHASPNQEQVPDFELLHPVESPHHMHDLAAFPQSTDASLIVEQSTDRPLEVLAGPATSSLPSTLHQPLPPWETQPLMNNSADMTLSATETVITHDFIGAHPALETSSHTSSFGDNHMPFFESTLNRVLEQPIESTHDEPKLDVSSRGQPIPFDSSLSGPSSPIFDREAMAVFMSPGRRQSSIASEYQTSSYSIMELASPMEPSQFFVQARQSPLLLDQFADLGSAPHVPKSALEQPNENDVSSFDQVSLVEDLSGPAPAQEKMINVSAPAQQKDRGLASLFDPATLGAVEDLLNMPKSAAFERGMSRLFKGVKSSASSMFASPLVQSPSVPVISTTQDASAHSQALVEGSSGVSTATSESQVHPTHLQDQATKVTLPPPPRRIDNDPPLAANMPQRDSVNMQSSEASSSSESHLSTSAEVILPPPPRAEHMQAKNALSPKLEGKSHKPLRVPRMQHDWAPKQPMFVDIESEVIQQESGDQSTTNPPEAQQSKDNHGKIFDMVCVHCYPSSR